MDSVMNAAHSSPSILPELNTATALKRTIGVHLISQSEMTVCNFWVGLFQKGSLEPRELFDVDNFDAVFAKAAQAGLSESTPVMLSDSSSSPARFMYLLPEPGPEEKQRVEWVQKLTATIKAWSSNKVGIYLAPELVSQRVMHELVQQIMNHAIDQTEVNDYYFQTSSHGLNSILNTTLKLRNDRDDVDLLVFH